MKFQLQHPMPADIETAWNVLMSEEFSIASYAHMGANRELLSKEDKDGKTLLSLKITLQNELPSVAAKVIGSSKLSWIQDQILDHSSRSMKWRIKIPSAEKITAQGSFHIKENGDYSVRIVEGDVNVNIPLLGKKIEKHVCTQLENSYEKSALFSQEWLQKDKN